MQDLEPIESLEAAEMPGGEVGSSVEKDRMALRAARLNDIEDIMDEAVFEGMKFLRDTIKNEKTVKVEHRIAAVRAAVDSQKYLGKKTDEDEERGKLVVVIDVPGWGANDASDTSTAQ